MRATCSCLLIFLHLIALMLIHATLISKILITQFFSPAISHCVFFWRNARAEICTLLRHKFVQLFTISSVLARPTANENSVSYWLAVILTLCSFKRLLVTILSYQSAAYTPYCSHVCCPPEAQNLSWLYSPAVQAKSHLSPVSCLSSLGMSKYSPLHPVLFSRRPTPVFLNLCETAARWILCL